MELVLRDLEARGRLQGHERAVDEPDLDAAIAGVDRVTRVDTRAVAQCARTASGIRGHDRAARGEHAPRSLLGKGLSARKGQGCAYRKGDSGWFAGKSCFHDPSP